MKKDFPLLHNEQIVYLDSAATTQKPSAVIKAISEYYETYNANIHRGLYMLSEEATKKYIEAKKTIAEFFNATSDEIIFTKNTTEAINIIANGLHKITERKEIVLTELEHHANIVPWLQLQGFSIKYIPLKGCDIDYDIAEEMITEKTAIVSVAHISNVFGTILDVKRLSEIAHKKGALFAIDGSQSPSHIPIDIKEINCDFFACSAHKAFGPMGIGLLYGKKELLDKLPPLLFGGDMIKTVSFTEASFADAPQKFEAGTQNVAGAIGFAEAIKYIKKISLDTIKKNDAELLTYALTKLEKIENIQIYHAGIDKGVAIISFTLQNIHPHDIASLLADRHVCIRAGHHCAMPLMQKLNIEGTVRASFSIYNSKEDVDALVEGLKKVQEVFHG